ncbi:MAG: hypothetical protein AMXMBFR84_08680 [Candidatus Hydrogenedentota bacterium]
MAKAVAVGEKRYILGFRGVGFDILECNDAEGLRRELHGLSRDADVALVLVSESLAMDAPDALDAFRERSQAVLTVIPTHEGSQNSSFARMKKMVEISIGVDILGSA